VAARETRAESLDVLVNRVTVDTNVIVSGLNYRGPSRRLLDLAEEQIFRLQIFGADPERDDADSSGKISVVLRPSTSGS
jgi:hypothetical protein